MKAFSSIFGGECQLSEEAMAQIEAERAMVACHDLRYHRFWALNDPNIERPESNEAWDAYWRGEYREASRAAEKRMADWEKLLSSEIPTQIVMHTRFRLPQFVK